MIKRVLNNSLYGDVATLAGGTGIAQALPVLISPILTRIYSPDEFGILAFYMAVVAMIGVASTGRYEMALLIPKKDRHAAGLYSISTMIIGAITIITLLIFSIFGSSILQYFGFDNQSILRFLIPAGILAFGIFQLATFLLNRNKKYTQISTAKILRSGTVSGGQLLMGFTGFSTYGLVFGKLFGDLLSSAYARWKASRQIVYKHKELWSESKIQAIKFQEFPKINAPHAVTNTASSQLPNVLLAGLFSTAIAGFYNLSFRVCYAPVQLIASSVHQVFSRSVSEKYNAGKNIHKFTFSTLKKLSLAAIGPFLILLLFAPGIFSFVFGSEWTIAGRFAQILTPYLFFVFIVSPLTFIPMLLKHQKKAFFIDIIYMISKVMSLIVGYLMGDAVIAVLSFSFVGVLFQSYILIWILSLTKSTI